MSKKRIAASTALPPPNLSHPASSLISTAIKTHHSHSHSSSYHAFIAADPSSSRIPVASASSSSPAKKRNAASSISSHGAFPSVLPRAIPASVLNEKLLRWYDSVKESRGMPWRVEVDVESMSKVARSQRGYEVWVSEIMLQQTQVATVIAYYNKWMLAFPTVKDLAEADIEKVNSIWAGLGYYSRASRLLKGAQTVMEQFNGILPIDAKELEKVDGIGPYSAGAISSIAFGQRAAVVDGNVTRVFSRLTAFHGVSTAKSTTNFIWALADILVPSPRAPIASGGPNKPGAWSQALMELGATVCTPKNPECGKCPLSEECLAYAEIRSLRKSTPFFAPIPKPAPSPSTSSSSSPSTSSAIVDIEECDLCTPFSVTKADHQVTQYPMDKLKKVVAEEETSVCVVEWRCSDHDSDTLEDMVLVVKRPEKGLLAGLYEFPAVDLPSSASHESTLRSRQEVLQNLLATLIVPSIPSLAAPSTSASSSPASVSKNVVASTGKSVRIASSTERGAILQIYSHQKRVYHIHHLIISSPSLPSLCTASSSSSGKVSTGKSSSLVQSLPNRGKWISSSKRSMGNANLGGAMIKVWDVVDTQSYGALKPKSKSRTAAAAIGSVGAKKATVMTKKLMKNTKAKGRAKDEYETEEGEDDDEEEEGDEMSMDESEESAVESAQGKSKAEKMTADTILDPSPSKKKRKIIIADDSDEG